MEKLNIGIRRWLSCWLLHFGLHLLLHRRLAVKSTLNKLRRDKRTWLDALNKNILSLVSGVSHEMCIEVRRHTEYSIFSRIISTKICRVIWFISKRTRAYKNANWPTVKFAGKFCTERCVFSANLTVGQLCSYTPPSFTVWSVLLLSGGKSQTTNASLIILNVNVILNDHKIVKISFYMRAASKRKVLQRLRRKSQSDKKYDRQLSV